MLRKKPATTGSPVHAKAAKKPVRKPKATSQAKAAAPTAFVASEQAGSTKWRKGQSGNPGGRPKEVAEIRDLARQYTEEAIRKLVDWMRDDSNARASVQACNVLLDRGWGKAPQSMELTGKDGVPLIPVLNVLYGG